jgi:hypothetical protein
VRSRRGKVTEVKEAQLEDFNFHDTDSENDVPNHKKARTEPRLSDDTTAGKLFRLLHCFLIKC